MSFSSDSSLFAVYANSGTIHIWKLPAPTHQKSDLQIRPFRFPSFKKIDARHLGIIQMIPYRGPDGASESEEAQPPEGESSQEVQVASYGGARGPFPPFTVFVCPYMLFSLFISIISSI